MGSIGYRAIGSAPAALALDLNNPYNYRAYIPDPPTETGWAVSISMRTGKATSTSPSMRGILFDASSGDPRAILGQTATFNPSVTMTSGADGQWRTDNLVAAVPFAANQKLALGAIATGARALLGEIDAATLGMRTNRTFYSRNDSSLPPADPMAWTSHSGVEGWMAIALNYDANQQPNTPFNRTMNGLSGNGLVSPTTTPVFAWDFTDPNQTLSNGLPGDSLNKIEIKVTRVSDGATMWYLQNAAATSAEKSASHPNRTYAGTALAADGTQYQWQGRHCDQLGWWSAWSSLVPFTVGAGQVVVSGVGLGTPTGKQETITPGPFTFKWTHSGGLATTAVQLRIVDAAGAPVSGFVSGDITKAVANNASDSVTWAATGFGSLQWDGIYGWQLRGKASDGNYSGWSAIVPFTTDFTPSVPSALTPDDVAKSDRPTLTCTATDPDDTVATGLTVKAEILDSTGTVLGAWAMTLRSGTTDTWDLVTTSTHLPGYDDYSWRAYSGDGTLWSGRQTVEASAVRSATAQFTYAAGPSLAITSPTSGSTIADTTPTLAWTAATQAAFQVRVYDLTAAGQPKIFDTGSVVTTLTGYTIPDGILTTIGNQYRLRVTVTDASALSTTADVAVTLNFTSPPAVTGYLASPLSLPGDNGAAGEASAVLLSFDPSTDPNFAYYLVRREPASGAPLEPFDESITAGPGGTKIFRIYDVNQTRLIDYSPASGVAYRYQVTQITTVGGRNLVGVYAVGEIMVTFRSTILYDVTDPEGSRVVLPYRGPRSIEPIDDTAFLQPWGRQKPTALVSDAWSKPVSASYPVPGETQAEINETIRKLNYLHAYKADVLFRTARGYRDFGVVKVSENDPEGGRRRAVTIAFSPTDYTEGV